MANSSTLEWQEESPSVWSRTLDRTELHFVAMRNAYANHGKEWGMLSTILKLDTSMSAQEFIARTTLAWKWVRSRHPILASTLSSDVTKRVYRIAKSTELMAWLSDTFIIHDDYDDAESFRPKMKPVERATLHVFAPAQQVLLQTPHHQIDGHSILCLVNMFLDMIANPQLQEPEFGAEAQLLAPAPSIAANYPIATPEQRAICQDEVNKWLSGFPSSRIGASNLRSPPSNTRSQRMVLSQTETTAVVKAAKEKGYTPTHVVEAAAIVAGRELEKKIKNIAEDRNYVSCGLFSLRPWCSWKFESATLPYVTFLPVVIKPASFLGTADQVKQYYKRWKTDSHDLLAIIEPTLETFAVMSSGSTEPNQMLSVSSFGRFEPRLESVHDSVTLKDFSFLYEIPDPGVTSFSWSRQGQLHWTICYNEAYHEEANIAEWISSSRSILLQGLGVTDTK
ncbi:hypothetical protein F4804DRAFT_304644 [Jackrogersella minutella]|nr:hypothetical protein F4804DRAFT_304644 [Jackrogersella minutella]